MAANNSTLTTNLNVTPYYDDYDQDKNFYRILFKPGYAVQARELTQIGTIAQKQVDRIGKHLFREGSIVIPGRFNIETNVDYIKIKDLNTSNSTVNIQDYLKNTLSSNTGVTAYVIKVEDGLETETNTKTFYLRYQSGSASNTQIKTFLPGETLTSNAGNIRIIESNSIGKGSLFTIEEGVVFAKEHFISFPTQSIIIDRYSTTPSKRVGFNVIEQIINYEDDLTLLDPALEASNYASPGADRLKLTCELQVLNYDDQTGEPNFVELFTIKDGVVTELYERTQYNVLKDEMAKRTYDESGDYYVNGLSVRVREHFDSGTNEGLSNTGNTQLLAIGVEPGVAYVKGYEISKLVTEYTTTEKSLDYENINSQISTVSFGNYVKVNEFTGYINHDTAQTVNLYDTENKRITNKKWSSGAQSGNIIGTAKVASIEYDSGVLGTSSGNVNIHLFDVQMLGSNTFSSVKSLYTTNFGADIVLSSSNTAILNEASQTALLYSVGSSSTRSIRDTNGNSDTSFNFKRTTTFSILSDGTFSIPIGTVGETFPYGTTTLTNTDKRDIIINIMENASILGTGTVTRSGGNTYNLIGSGTSFTNLNVGDKIEITGLANTYFVAAIANNTHLTTSEPLASGISGNTYSKVYKTGDAIDLTSRSFSASGLRTVSATPTNLSIDLGETFGSTKSAAITYQVNRSSAREISKELRVNRYVAIDCSTAGISGPFNLGVSDVYKIKSITLKSGSIPTNVNDGSNVTSSFTFDNGQRDTLYDHATISPNISLSSTSRLLVCLDYFEPVYTLGVGYFSIDSYPINDVNPTSSQIKTENIPIYISTNTKKSYDLRNYIDFRPIKLRTASDATTPGAATTNPSTTNNFNYDVNGLRFPVPSSQYVYDYSYYLSRIDIVGLNKDGNIIIVRGVPAQNPRTPNIPENIMALASIYIKPYPSLAPNYAQSIGRADLATLTTKLSNVRHTMRDIGVLKNRISNLEYYAALNLLERSAIEMQIIDENGLNRFKNGIFVDTFSDHSLADYNNPNYRIVVDDSEKSIRPVFTTESFGYNLVSNTNTIKTGDLITLSYSETPLITQNSVTSFRNVELTSYRYIGNLVITPDIDVWVDTQKLPDENISNGPTTDQLPENTTVWNAWQKTVTGYTVEQWKNPSLTVRKTDVRPGNYTTLPKNAKIVSSPNSARDSRVTETSVSTRTGTQTTYSLDTKTENLGSKVVDVALIPYIRPQILTLTGRGLKPNTEMFVFFDGENMTKYTVNLPSVFSNYTTIAAEGTQKLITNAFGEIYIGLRLPKEKQFRVGTKEVILTDSPTNSTTEVSTYCKGYFVSQGLIQQKKDTILTTRKIISTESTVSETVKQTKSLGFIDNPSCIAYSFIPKVPDGEEGIFLTSIDIYLKAKHPTLGIWVEIREMDSSGGITRNQVPFSEVWLPSSELVTSDNATVPQNIKFKSPLFLYNDTQYAFVIHTIGLNPDTYIWISRLGEVDIKTGTKVNSRPLKGTFYTTNNNLNWDIVPDIDLFCTFYRADFNVGVAGQAIIGNKPVEKLRISNVSSQFTEYGETISGDHKLTLTGNTASIVVTDILVGANSGGNSAITNINGSIFTVLGKNYTVGENVSVYSNTYVSKGITATISNIDFSEGYLDKYSDISGKQYINLRNSNGKFEIGERIEGLSSKKTANVEEIIDYRYSVTDFEPTLLKFKGTSLDFDIQTTSYATGLLLDFVKINESDNYYFDSERKLLSRSNEIDNLASANSNKIRINMSTTSRYVSPIVDLGRTHSIYVDSLINANTYAEEYTGLNVLVSGNTGSIIVGDRLISGLSNSTVLSVTGNNISLSVPTTNFEVNSIATIYAANLVSKNLTTTITKTIKNNLIEKGGALENKYISGIVTLDEGQDAEDILVTITAYRPPGSDINAWVKFSHREDAEPFDYNPWIPLDMVDPAIYSSISDRDDFREYRFYLNEKYLTGENNAVVYENAKGIEFSGFKQFSVKIGLLGNDSASVPRVADLRILALQK